MSAASPCPLCGLGAFYPGRSLSNHLSRYCSVQQQKQSGSKRSHEDLLQVSRGRPTVLQQVKEFNSFVSRDASLPTNNPLHFSSAQHHVTSDEEIRFGDIEDVLFENNIGHQENNNNLDMTQKLPLETCPFRRKSICLPPDLQFQVHLMHDLSKHRGNDLNLHENVLQCIKSNASCNDVDFKSLNILSRKRLIQLLTKYYKLDFLKPILHTVALLDGTVATVPVFDVKAKLISFLNDPHKMRRQNIASNYDIFTGKPISPTNVIDEIHTGSLWADACHKYCGDDPLAFPLGLVCFYDKTHSDVYGSLACAPFIAVPSFLNRDCRNDDSNYMVFGYIPNLGYGKSKSNQLTPTMKLQDEHNCLSLITNQLKNIHEEGGFWTKVFGRRVCVKVWIHFIAGDNAGHNNLVGHMNGGKPKYIFRDCRCTNEQMSTPIPQCRFITMTDMNNARLTNYGLADLCKKDIQNAFDGAPLSDQVHGLLGCVPSEMLHVSGTGILKYIFECLINIIGSPQRTKRDQESFDELHRCMVVHAQQQSERDFLRMSV